MAVSDPEAVPELYPRRGGVWSSKADPLLEDWPGLPSRAGPVAGTCGKTKWNKRSSNGAQLLYHTGAALPKDELTTVAAVTAVQALTPL